MNNWKLVKKITIVFGIVSIVFIVLAAITNYELNHILYLSSAPASLFDYSITIAMLPFLFVAVLSFVLAFLSSRAAKSETEETEAQEKEAKEQAEAEAQAEAEVSAQETETEPDAEDVFKETPT